MVVGFIGLGRMGELMSANLQRAGFRLRTWDKAKTGNCASARDAATGADVLITMLPDGKAVAHAVLAALPGLRRGKEMKAFRERARRGEAIPAEEMTLGMMCFGRL